MSAVLEHPSRLQRVIERAHTDIKIVDWSPQFFDQALLIAREMHAGSIYRDIPLDERKVLAQLAGAGTSRDPSRYFRIAVLNGEGLGGFYGSVHRAFFSDDLIANDMGWWVKREARNTLAALLLLADFERWAREKGAKKVMVGQVTDVDVERTTKLFEACGFRVVGMNAVKSL